MVNKIYDYIDELAIKGRNGDMVSVQNLTEKLKPLIVSVAYRYARYNVDDTIQEGYLLLLECIKKYNEKTGSFLAFFKTSYKYHVMNITRKDREYLSLNEEVISNDDIDEQIFDAVELSYIRKAIQKLNEKQRDVIIRYYIKGESLKKIAQDKNQHYQSVIKLKERALEKLKEYLSCNGL